MMERMPASEFFEWMILESIEPFGDRRGDIQAGLVAMTYANANRTPNTNPYPLSDFLPEWEPSQEPIQTQEKQTDIMMLIQAMQNTRVNE